MHRTLDILRRGIDQSLHGAAQVVVIHKDQVVLDDVVGPITRDHLMLWMSAGKPLAAVAVLQLVHRGLIALDTRVAEVIPEFDQLGKGAITLEHLLTHTAGFRGPMNNFTPGDFASIIARVCQLRQEPNWTPGEKAGYHIGSSWFVLGELIQRLTGQSFSDYIQSHVAPGVFIGMSQSELDANRTRLVEMRVTDASNKTPFAGNTDEAIRVPRPGANARGPIRLLARFYDRLFKSTLGLDDLLEPSLASRMTTRQRTGMHDHTFNQTLDWGLGVMIDSKQYAGEHLYGFGPFASPLTFGHSGNQSSCGFVDPVHGLIAGWACDAMPGEPVHQTRQREINAAIYLDLGLA